MAATTLKTMKTVSPLSFLWRFKLQLQRWVLFASSITFTLLVFVQVVSRYLFNHSIFGIEESASYLAAIMYFIGAAYGTHMKEHISASIVDTLFKPGAFVNLAHLLTRVISTLLCAYLCWETWHLVQFNFEFDTRSVELRIPMAWVYGGMLTGMVLMTFYFFIDVIQACHDLFKPKH